ncbi:MAG: hypothetical protein ACYTG6_10395 [Planctomycetota bacterium]|jgi:hypothetical protein
MIHAGSASARRWYPGRQGRGPYCSGDAETIEKTGDYKNFCEFKPGEDPINFGFRPDSSRFQQG